MLKASERFALACIANTVSWSQRHCYGVIAVTAVLGMLSAWFTVTHIGINTNTEDMLSEQLDWRIAYADFKRAFPFFSDTLVIVVDGVTPDLATETADALRRDLERNTHDFDEIFHPIESDFFRHNQLLYTTSANLEQLADRLSGAQALLGRLSATPDLGGLLALLHDIASARTSDLRPEATRLLTTVGVQVDAILAGNTIPMSWQALLAGNAGDAQKRVVFTARPRLDFSTILPASTAINSVRRVIHERGYDTHPGIEVRLTGGAALGFDELSSVIRGAEQAGVLALVMIIVCLGVGLRSLSLVIATLATLIVGLIFTATFAAVAVGTLNMISVAFAVLYVGLGVDFAIHLGLRYRELCAEHGQFEAIGRAAHHIGGSIMLCAVTTSIGFFAFIPTAYRGVAELGLISGVGMFIGLATSFTVLPALLQALPAPRVHPTAQLDRKVSSAAQPRRASGIIFVALTSAALAAVVIPRASFDLNPLHLNDPNAESVTTIAELAETGEQPLYDISVVVADGPSAERLAAQLAALDTVASVRSANDLVPAEQAAKLAIIEDLRWTLGEDLRPGRAAPIDPARLSATVDELIRALERADDVAEADPARATLTKSLQHLRSRLGNLSETETFDLFAAVERKLMQHFSPQVERLADALEASAVDLESLPQPLRQRWIAADGRYRLEIRPAQDLDDNDRLAHFVDSVQNIAGRSATGTPIINIEASRAVSAAFHQAFASAVF